MSDNIAATRGAATGRPLDILLWCVQAFLALVFVNASWAKLMGKPEMVALFTAVGFGQWFRYVTGILALTGAVLIMCRRRGELDPRCSRPSQTTGAVSFKRLVGRTWIMAHYATEDD